MAIAVLLKRMKRDNITVHGFRSTFRDWTAERTNYPREVAEMALAHAVGDKVEAAYRRGDLLEKRLQLMRDWATSGRSGPRSHWAPIQIQQQKSNRLASGKVTPVFNSDRYASRGRQPVGAQPSPG